MTRTRPFTDDELSIRRPVWSSLSDLFLDTEVRPSVPFAALTCLASGYDDATLDLIWRHEVAPVLAPNLLSVAGEWAMFDLAWLEARIGAKRWRVFDGAAAWLVRDIWAEVGRLRGWLEPWPEQQRPEVALAVSSLIWLALDGTEATWLHALARSGLDQGELQRAWSGAAEPLLRALLVRGEDPPVEELLARGEQALRRARPRNGASG